MHHGGKTPVSVAAATAALADGYPPAPAEINGAEVAGMEDEGPMKVREKEHQAIPMTLDQALYEMELVGHDFYLFVDKDSQQPAVVYRRRGYDYGVIRLAAGDMS